MTKKTHFLTVITPEGVVTYTPGKADLTALQSAVGGYIATADLVTGISGYVDDEGILKQYPFNPLASLLSQYGQKFFGNWAGNLTSRQVDRMEILVANAKPLARLVRL